MNINAEIKYKYPYKWDYENTGGRPIVNLLLKALLERDFNGAQTYIQHGASLQEIDETTLKRSLYVFLNDYKRMEFLCKNGFNGILFPHINCIDQNGYCHDLTDLTYELQNWDVLDLLFANGFDPSLDIKLASVVQKNATLIDLILSHGYPKEYFLSSIKYFVKDQEKNPMYQYIENRYITDFRSYGLGDLHRKIEKPVEPKNHFYTSRRQRIYQKRKYYEQLHAYNAEIEARQKYIDNITYEMKQRLKEEENQIPFGVLYEMVHGPLET